jgi:hypothetical protein
MISTRSLIFVTRYTQIFLLVLVVTEPTPKKFCIRYKILISLVCRFISKLADARQIEFERLLIIILKQDSASENPVIQLGSKFSKLNLRSLFKAALLEMLYFPNIPLFKEPEKRLSVVAAPSFKVVELGSKSSLPPFSGSALAHRSGSDEQSRKQKHPLLQIPSEADTFG